MHSIFFLLGQATHAFDEFAADVFEYLPAMQSWQSCVAVAALPLTSLNLPAAQATHSCPSGPK